MAAFVRKSDKAVVNVGRWMGRNILAFCEFLKRDCQAQSNGPLEFVGDDGEKKSVPLGDVVVVDDKTISVIKLQELHDGYHSL